MPLHFRACVRCKDAGCVCRSVIKNGIPREREGRPRPRCPRLSKLAGTAAASGAHPYRGRTPAGGGPIITPSGARPITRQLLASFIEYAMKGCVTSEEVRRFMNTYYDDEAMETAKRELGRLLPHYSWINGVGTFARQPVPREHLERLSAIARDLRRTSPNRLQTDPLPDDQCWSAEGPALCRKQRSFAAGDSAGMDQQAILRRW
jgi:hypothetical protein